MNVETLIYAYLVICVAMIFFNCICIFFFRHQDHILESRSADLKQRIVEEIGRLRNEGNVSETHISYLRKKLRYIRNLMAFDETLDDLLEKQPDAAKQYIEAVRSAFTWITAENYYKTSMQMAYFAYVIAKYHILMGKASPLIVEFMLKLLDEPSLYCRENALQAIYSMGDCSCVLQALHRLDAGGRFHHGKLLTDGFLKFSGEQKQLMAMLWQQFDTFSVPIQVAILDYIRFSGGRMQDELLTLLADEGRDDELRFSCIRYFAKNPDDRAYPLLLSFLVHSQDHRWEYAAVSATALASYPGERTVLALKRSMSNANWYIRFNAAKSLEKFQLTYQDLGDVMDGGDRYAREILQYRLDVRKAQNQEVV